MGCIEFVRLCNECISLPTALHRPYIHAFAAHVAFDLQRKPIGAGRCNLRCESYEYSLMGATTRVIVPPGLGWSGLRPQRIDANSPINCPNITSSTGR